MTKKTALLACVLCLTLLAGACQAAPDTPENQYERMRMHFMGTFDTLVIILGYTPDAETFARVTEGAQARFERFHQVYDAYNAYDGVNNLYVLNRDGGLGVPIQVEPELLDLLLYCRDMQPRAENRTNIAMGAVLGIWHTYREAGEGDPSGAVLPPMAALREAALHTNFDDVIIDEAAGTVHFADPKLRLDVGAVAKGYATQQVGEWMLAGEMPSFLLSAGGNMYAGNPPEDGRDRWGIGIQDPDGNAFSEDASEYIDTLFLANGSVVTSGDYQRGYTVDGRWYHHIISPDTLMPADYYRSITVVADDSGWADMLSTALYTLPYDEGRALADSLAGVEVYWILNDGQRTIQMTDGMRAMAKSQGATSTD